MAMSKKNTPSEDALKNQKLHGKRLLSSEAQRISTILENCISQCEIAVTLPAVLQLNMSNVADGELSKALQEHQILSESLETLKGLEHEPDGEQEEEVEEATSQLEKDIKNSVRGLLRLVRAHPEAISGLRAELGMGEGESEYTLIRGLRKFHSHMVEKLLTSVEEEIHLALYKPVSPSPAHDLEHMALLEQELATSTKKIDAEISRKNVKIQELENFLQGKNTQVVDMELFADKHCQSYIKTSKEKQSRIQQDIDQLNTQLNNLILENRQAERALQEKNEKVETEIEYLLHSFDNEIEENQADLELNEMDYEREEEELRQLEKPFSLLEVESNQIQEKRRLAEEKRKEEMKELELKTKAAIFAQAWWRGYSTRKALKNKGKSKKAKKGKGKKTK